MQVSNNINNIIPIEVMSYVFTYLNSDDLKRAACVCRFWKQATEDTNIIWRGLCSNELDFDDNELPKLSWRYCYETLTNWKTGVAIRLNTFSLQLGWSAGTIGLLPDRTPFYFTWENSYTFSRFSANTNKFMDTWQFEQPIFSTYLHENTLVCFTGDGCICCYDIVTKNCTQTLKFANELGIDCKLFDNEFQIGCTNNEVVARFNNIFACWNRLTGELLQQIHIDDFKRLRGIQLSLTKKHIVYQKDFSPAIYTLNRKTEEEMILFTRDKPSRIESFASNDHLVAFLCDGEIIIYDDKNGSFERVNLPDHFSLPNNPCCLCFYRNWLLIGGSEETRLWDTNHLDKNPTIIHEPSSKLSTNGRQLIIQRFEQSDCKVLDFERKQPSVLAANQPASSSSNVMTIATLSLRTLITAVFVKNYWG